VEDDMKRFLLLSLFLLTVAAGIQAAPYSTLGELNAPDAYVLPHKAAELTFTNYFRREYSDFVGQPPYEYYPMGKISLGLWDRLALGVWAGDEVSFLDAKLMLLEETGTRPQIAIGIDNVFSPMKEDVADLKPGDDCYGNPDAAYYEKNSPYICMTKAFVLRNYTGLKLMETYLTAGIGQNKFKAQTDFSKRFEGLFSSITTKPHKDLSFTFEFDGCDFNVGGAFSYHNIGLKVAYEGLEEEENNRFGIAITYLFDKYSTSKQRQGYWQVGGVSRGAEMVSPELQGGTDKSNEVLMEELQKLREQREQAQKVLDALQEQLKKLEEESGKQ